jgi:hypothetical protein
MNDGQRLMLLFDSLPKHVEPRVELLRLAYAAYGDGLQQVINEAVAYEKELVDISSKYFDASRKRDFKEFVEKFLLDNHYDGLIWKVPK